MTLAELDLTPSGPTQIDGRRAQALAETGARPATRTWPPVDPKAAAMTEKLARICETAGLLLDLQMGSQAWIDAIAEQGGWVNPTFDPLQSEVDETTTGSVVIRDGDGRFLACNAVRLFETDSFVATMRRGELFHRPGHPNSTPLQPILPAGYDLGGRISYSGGTLVDPAARGKRLALLTTRLVRLIGEQVFRADWHAGHIFHTRSGEMPAKPYGFQRITPCLEALTIPERPQPQTLYLVELSRAEFREQLAADLERLEAEGRENLDDLALLA